jgi:hypothetical protein
MMIAEIHFDVKVHAGEESLADGCAVKKHQARSTSATAAYACFPMIATTAAGDLLPPSDLLRALMELESIATMMTA